MNPSDIATILTAAAPIVASIASSVSANNKSEESQKGGTSEKSVNVTINNHFYTNSEQDAIRAATQIQNQVVSSVVPYGRRYEL